MSSPPNDDDDSLLRALGARVRDERASSEHDAATAFDDAMADRIAAKVLATTDEATPPVVAKATVPEASRAPSEPPSKVVPLPAVPGIAERPPSRRFYFVMGPLAAAAAILLVVALRPAGPALPGYEVAVVAAKATRSDPNAPVTETLLDPAGDFELVARPAVASSRVTVRAIVVREGKAAPWNVPAEVSPDGAVRIAGKVATLFENPQGRVTVVLLLAAGARQPSVDEALRIAEGKATADEAIRVVRAEVRFLAR